MSPTAARHGRTFARPADFNRYLDSLGLFHMDFGLHRIRAVMRALTDLGLPAPQAAAQVVGTNGKGSTSAFLESILRAHGVATGLYTSPHMLSPRERIRLDGRPIHGRAWIEAANAVAGSVPGAADPASPKGLTYFEVLTAMAAYAFAAAGTRAAIYEAGLGAAGDATAALHRDLVLLAPIAMDHAAVIGPTLADIARDKAQALQPGMSGLTGPQPSEVMSILSAQAAAIGAPLDVVASLPDRLGSPALGLAGPHQTQNAALAVAGFLRLAPLLGVSPDDEAIRRGLANAFIPGRLQYVTSRRPGFPDVILDGAHNPHAITALARSIDSLPSRPQALVFACMADKDVRAMIPLAAKLTDGPILLPPIPNITRAMPPRDLARLFGPRAHAAQSLRQALADLGPHRSPTLICGSLYLLAEYYRLNPRALLSKKHQDASGGRGH